MGAAVREDHAPHLNDLRRHHYDELKREALRQKAIAALREDEAAPTTLDRHEMLELRGQLDDEMPWQFGFPSTWTPIRKRCLPRRSIPTRRTAIEHHEADHHETGQATEPASITRRHTATPRRSPPVLTQRVHAT